MPLSAIHAAYRHRRYEVLFWSLVSTLVATPVCAALHIPHAVIEVFLAANLVAALAPFETPSARRAAAGVFVVAVIVRLAVPHGWFFGVVYASLGVFAAGAALRHAIRATQVSRDHVCAGLSAYLLAGLFCGHLYWAMERHTPGSVTMQAGEQGFTLAKGVYFSFATLTTVGFGDIVPRTEAARGIVTLEAVAGQLYLAVLVARLISLYVSRKAP